ncbi:hypothetical protein FOQG_18482 [Fusarium oxysporum f. sp. raphani 54005]|uniref:Uncharacterized protein n=1 Tax=Fusarium oxysporum f. sp. raphani 54005 TaxID=1089458 RepID=X0BD97_FUSOX|nr:hypothetical protein FOQG_18482 [Fusarium oxysporum f. sp. raphani 54005]
MSLTGGQQPRWPELSSLWVENDELGPRGLYVHKGYFIYVVRHRKAKRSTNREFVVVRFLPAELALAVFKYCTYIRPFINLLDRERGVNSLAIASQSSSPLLFRTQSLLSNSKPWHTSRFTNVLRKVTFKVWGFTVNSRLLRQICIGITEKHVREVFQPFNRFDDRSKDAHRNVVFAWQSGHRPLQRQFTYGLDGAFPTTMQPQLLDLYEWASLRWHEFLHLPSKLRPRMNAQIQSDRERVLGHQPNATAESNGETAERSIAETRLTPGQKRADAGGRGREQKSSSPGEVRQITSPPAKRRRIDYVAASPVDEINPSLTELEAPELFGNPHEPCSHDDIKERRAVLQFLRKYSSARSEKWLLHDQLTRVYETLEWWEFVGCQLCFVAKGGQPEPDHTVESCFQSAGNEKARQILRWLDPEAKRHLTERLESKSGLDGHCEKKPIIRSVIAALCAYDNQFLGKILLKFGQDGDGKNLNDDQDARSWFEADIHLDNFTFPRLFMVFELLVLSFYFRANQSRELPELAGFPEKAPAGLMSTSHSNREESKGLFLQDKCPPWDNAEEVAAWKESVEWWKGKCSFCAGRGLGGALMEHTLQQCQRGGASKLESELGIA